MSGAANRRRGADAERAVVNHLRTNGWPDARRYLAGDGRQPGDIDWHPLVSLEVKDVKNTTWPTWCRQAVAAARPGLIAAVVRRERGQGDVGLWPCRVRATIVGSGDSVYASGQVAEWLGGGWNLTRGVPGDPGLWLSGTFDRLLAAVAAVDAGGQS